MDDRLRLYSQREVQELYRLGRHIYGNPTPMSHPRSRSAQPIDAMRGLVAENVVASVLNLLTLERDDLYAFHCVGISDDLDGETDHILVYKKSLLVIETKNRAKLESVSISKDGTTYARRKGQRIKISSNNLTSKVEFYKKKYPDFTVEGLLVVHFDTKKMGSEYSNCSVVSVSRIIDELLNRIDKVKQQEVDLWPVVKNFASLCIRNELIP